MDRVSWAAVVGLVWIGFGAAVADAQDSPVVRRLDGFGLQVHKVVDGADWLIEQLYVNNSVSGVVRQPDGAADFLACRRTGYSDTELQYQCNIAVGPPAIGSDPGVPLQAELGWAPLPDPVVLPVAFFGVEEDPSLARFPPRVERFVSPVTGPAETVQGGELRPTLTLIRRDAVHEYFLAGGIEVDDGGRPTLSLLEAETGASAVLATTPDPDGSGGTQWDYKLTVPGDESCVVHFFNIAEEPLVSLVECMVRGVGIDTPIEAGACLDPLDARLPNEAAAQTTGRALLGLEEGGRSLRFPKCEEGGRSWRFSKCCDS